MPSLIDLRRRVRAVKNTQQITKAMKMVAASKLRRAQERIVNARPYAVQMQRVLQSVGARVDPSVHSWLLTGRVRRPDGLTLVVVVTGDQGPLRSFNTNVIKGAGGFIAASAEPCELGLVGRKGRDFFGRRGFSASSRSASSRSSGTRTRRRLPRSRLTRSRPARSIAWSWSTTSSSR